MTQDPFKPFRELLAWLDSHDGRLERRHRGGQETDSDVVAAIPTPPGQAIFTVGDLRALVLAGQILASLRQQYYTLPEDAYGCCPTCGAACWTRERRLDGNDTCINGHTYPSRDAVHSQEKP